ncbi:neuroplastin [Plakobranchus ocellatus]|uniref:Neuroplastin n=1 Tax=Plakobranchus ocellatus TaxID=259542 RepID=A0AAV4C4N9_9GAST|nr:neuroplastin [Plakobranchus ocellatus]
MMCRALYFAVVAAVIGLGFSQSDQVSLMIEPADRKLLVLAGEQQKLVCKATFPNKGDQVVWQLAHQQDGNITLKIPDAELVDGQYTKTLDLTFVKFSAAYAGKYSCTYIPFGASSPTHTSTIDLVSVSAQRSDVAYNYGNETVTLHCTANLEDAKFSKWLKNNETIEKGDKYDLDDKPFDCVVNYPAGPLVLDMDKSINAVEDDTVNIDCDVKGWPTPEVEWWVNDEKKLENSSVVSFEEYKGVKGARLVLTGVTFDYDGMYECRAYSAKFNETSKKSIKLRVKDKLAWLWPFLGIIVEVVVLILLILFFEKIKKKNGSDNPHPHEQ